MPRKARGYWVEPHPASGIWRICWTEDRRKRTRSTGLRDQEEAEQYLARFLDALSQPDQPERPTVNSLMAAFIAQKEGAAIERTVRNSRSVVRHLGWMTAEDLRPSHTVTYAAKRRKEGVQDGTIRTELQKLSACLNWAMGERLISVRPAVRYPPKPDARSRWLTKEEARRLLDACRRHHMRLFITLALSTAARKSALLELTWKRVDWGTSRIDLGGLPGMKPRAVVPITPLLMAALQEARDAAQTPYVLEWAGHRLWKIERSFRATCARAGLEGVTPHDLRRTAATWMALDGVEMRKISLYLGHRSMKTTETVYARYSPDYLKDAADALDW